SLHAALPISRASPVRVNSPAHSHQLTTHQTHFTNSPNALHQLTTHQLTTHQVTHLQLTTHQRGNSSTHSLSDSPTLMSRSPTAVLSPQEVADRYCFLLYQWELD